MMMTSFRPISGPKMTGHACVEHSVESRSSLYRVIQTYRAVSYLAHALTSMFDIFDNFYDGFYVSDFILYQWGRGVVAPLLWAAGIRTSGHPFEKTRDVVD